MPQFPTNEKLIRYKQRDDADRLIVLDTETTGFSNTDEVLQLAIINETGETLFDSNIKPKHCKTWHRAQGIHGISPAEVADAPSADDVREEVERIFSRALFVVGYNIDYDLRMLTQSGLISEAEADQAQGFDVMVMFAPIWGDWSENRKEYRWCKLTECADYYGYHDYNDAHNALADARATLFCFEHMRHDPEAMFAACGL